MYAFHDYSPYLSCLQVDMKNFSHSVVHVICLPFAGFSSSPADKGDGDLRLSQYNSRNITHLTLADFAYAMLSSPSTSILWQTQLRSNVAFLLSVLR